MCSFELKVVLFLRCASLRLTTLPLKMHGNAKMAPELPACRVRSYLRTRREGHAWTCIYSACKIQEYVFLSELMHSLAMPDELLSLLPMHQTTTAYQSPFRLTGPCEQGFHFHRINRPVNSVYTTRNLALYPYCVYVRAI